MPSSDDRARSGGVPSHAANYGASCRAPGFVPSLSISRTLVALLLLSLRLLLGLLLVLLLGLLRLRWCLP
jgi:hypothetical protein